MKEGVGSGSGSGEEKRAWLGSGETNKGARRPKSGAWEGLDDGQPPVKVNGGDPEAAGGGGGGEVGLGESGDGVVVLGRL